MPKGTSRAEATSNSEKIKVIVLAIIELCLTESISQVVSQSKENSVKFLKKIKIPWQLFERILGQSENFILSNQYSPIVVWEN